MKNKWASQVLDPFLPPLGEASAQLLGWPPDSSRTCLSETSMDLHVHIHVMLPSILDVCAPLLLFPTFLSSLLADLKNVIIQEKDLDFYVLSGFLQLSISPADCPKLSALRNGV